MCIRTGTRLPARHMTCQQAFKTLDKLAHEEGERSKLDVAKLDACIAKQDESVVRASMKQGDSLGVNGTPTLFINGERISGALPQAELWIAIDRALREAGVQPPPQVAETTKKPDPASPQIKNMQARGERPLETFPEPIRMRTAFACASISIAAGERCSGCKQSYGPDVVATVNGQPIQRSEVEKLYRDNLGNNKEQPTREQAEATRLGILKSTD